MKLNVVLFEPEIPQNTGNIARTCAATGAVLHLVGPLGFSIDDKHMRRAGLDYWDAVRIVRYSSIDEFFALNPSKRMFFFTTKGRLCHSDADYRAPEVWLVFGKETEGIPEEILKAHPDAAVRIPMVGDTRSLNLSNSVAVAVYEALRQNGYEGFRMEGALHRLQW